ncbi:MAG: hypothetical protein FJ096_13270, partial [Deltaproteobacteria bacterium]|nr:hypothetical protein [Deltaproteobacteria bacterium]
MKRAFALLGILAACRSEPSMETPPTSSAKPPPDDRALGESMLASERLPTREEVVALADRLAVASVRAGRTPSAGELAWLAAQLRERAYRHDKVESDGREALELYEAAATRAQSASVSCQAEQRRALLSGELANDAATTFRELYVAHERQSSLEGDRSGCIDRMKHLIDEVAAYRPTGQGWLELQEHARHE